jgi:hypothetical protein
VRAFAVAFILDVVWVLWMLAVEDRRHVLVGIVGAVLIGLSGLLYLGYMADPWTVLWSMAGGGLGGGLTSYCKERYARKDSHST